MSGQVESILIFLKSVSAIKCISMIQAQYTQITHRTASSNVCLPPVLEGRQCTIVILTSQLFVIQCLKYEQIMQSSLLIPHQDRNDCGSLPLLVNGA